MRIVTKEDAHAAAQKRAAVRKGMKIDRQQARAAVDRALGAIRAAGLAPAPAAAEQPGGGFQPIPRETIRRALGLKPEKRETDRSNAPAASPPRPSGDYFALVDQVRRERECSRVEAMKEVNRRWPEAWGAMLRAANPANARAAEIADRAKGRE